MRVGYMINKCASLLLFLLIVLNILPAAILHASPNLGVQMAPPPAGVNLSAEGTRDWPIGAGHCLEF